MARTGMTVSATATLVALALLAAGCSPGSGGGPVGDDEIRNFGPPYFEISFVDQAGYVGTVGSTSSTIPLFLRGVGSEGDIPGALFAAPWRPGSSLQDPQFAVQNSATGDLHLVDGGGVTDDLFENVVPHLYSFSPGSNYMVYVKAVVDSQMIVTEAIYPQQNRTTGLRIGAPYEYTSRPSPRIGLNHIAIAYEDTENPSDAVLAVASTDGEPQDTRAIRAGGPAYSHQGDLLAFIDHGPGAADAEQLVVVDAEDLASEQARMDFGGIARGATALTWSPDDNRIAFYAGVFTDSPVVCIAELNTQTINEFPLGDTPVVGTGSELLWAAPEWSPSGDLFAMLVEGENDTTGYTLISVTTDLNASAVTTISSGLEAPTALQWRTDIR